MLFSLFSPCSSSFFFNHTATTEIYTLSLHDALPILRRRVRRSLRRTHRLKGDGLGGFSLHSNRRGVVSRDGICSRSADRKSTRLNSSHSSISYAVFCLKKKKKKKKNNKHYTYRQ